MNRRSFLKTSAIGSIAAYAGHAALAAASSTPNELPATPGPAAPTAAPVLQAVSETAATVVWTTSTPSTGWVEYGETEALGLTANGEDGGLLPYDPRVLRVRLTGLKPGTTYFYRVQTAPVDFRGAYDIHRGTGVAGPLHQFRTFNAAADSMRFVMWNDTHQNRITLRRLVEQLPSQPADFLLWNGDLFNDVTNEETLILETLDPVNREYAASLPLVFARGNHDVRGAHARQLGRTLERHEGKYYFSFRQGPVAFIVLDTGEDKTDDHPEYGGLGDFSRYRAEQVPWLQRAVQDPEWQSAAFRVLITHIPLRGCPDQGNAKTLIWSEDSRAKWEPILASARIDAAFSGHTHRYFYSEPTAAQPWPLFVGGGPQPDKATFLHVEANDRSLRVKMFDLGARELGHWDIARRA